MLALGTLLVVSPVGTLVAQDPQSVRLHIVLAQDSSPRGARAPIVRSENLLVPESRWLVALRSGLPVRLHYRVEVWRSREGWFDNFGRQVEWDVVVRHEPLLDQYTVLTLVGARRQERRYATLDALGAVLAFAYQINMRPEVDETIITPHHSRCRPFRTPISMSWSAFWQVTWPGRPRERRTSVMPWDAERRGFCCALRVCRVSDWRLAARALW